MSLGYQARAMNRGLSILGEPALLRGVDAGRVNLARSVVLDAGVGDTAEDNPVVRYDIARISNAYSPRVGDQLDFVDEFGALIPGESYILDRLIADNRHTSRYIVVRR